MLLSSIDPKVQVQNCYRNPLGFDLDSDDFRLFCDRGFTKLVARRCKLTVLPLYDTTVTVPHIQCRLLYDDERRRMTMEIGDGIVSLLSACSSLHVYSSRSCRLLTALASSCELNDTVHHVLVAFVH